MYCGNCGNKLMEGSNFCAVCGAAVQDFQKRTMARNSAWKWFIAIGCCIVALVFLTLALTGTLDGKLTSVQNGSEDSGSNIAVSTENDYETSTTREDQKSNDAETVDTEENAENESEIKKTENIWPVNNPISDASFQKKAFYTTLFTNDAENECWKVIAYEIIEISFTADEMQQLLSEGSIEFITLRNAELYDDAPQYFQPNRYSFVRTDNPNILYLSCETDDGHVDDKPWPTVDGSFDAAEPDTGKGYRRGLGYADYQFKKANHQYILRQFERDGIGSTIGKGSNALFLGNVYELRMPYGLPIYSYEDSSRTDNNGYQDGGRVQDIGSRCFRYLCDMESTDLVTTFSAKDGIVTFAQASPYYDMVPLDIHRLTSPEGKFNN